MTQSLPPGFSLSGALSIMRSTSPSSSFTAMRMAWKLRLAGCCFSRRAAAGMALLMSSTSSRVLSTGFCARAARMAAVMRRA